MAKRFIDTNYFNDPFILSLKRDDKLLYLYFFTICDHAGIFELNEPLGNFHLGCNNFLERINSFMETHKGKIIKLNNSHFLIMSYCRRQYPKGVNTKVKQIQSALDILSSWNIEVTNDQTFTLRVNKGYVRVNNSYGNDNESGNGIGNGNEGGVGDKEKAWERFKITREKIHTNSQLHTNWSGRIGLNVNQIKRAIFDFFEDCHAKEDIYQNELDYKSYCFNWIKKYQSKYLLMTEL